MDPRFETHIEALPSALEELLHREPKKVPLLSNRVPAAGIYLLSEGSRHLYVGRTRDIGKRLHNHFGTWRQAAFAFRLAREATGKVKPSYRRKDSREALMRDPAFANAFEQASARIREMDARYVEVADPIRQYLLEVYVAVALDTPYNDFDTH